MTHTKPDKATSIIQTNFGEAEITIEQHKEAGRLVLYCFMPPCGGAGIFMQFFGNTSIADATGDMKQVINLGPHEENQNLSDHFNFHGCLAVGTGSSVINQVRAAVTRSQHPLSGLPPISKI